MKEYNSRSLRPGRGSSARHSSIRPVRMASPQRSPTPHRRREAPGAPRRVRRADRPRPYPSADPARRLSWVGADPDPEPFIPAEVEPEFKVASDPQDTSVIGDCSICFDPIQVRSSINLTCSHVFHIGCLNQWRQTQNLSSNQCPLCRRRLQQIRGLQGIVQHYRRVLDRVQRDMENELIDLTRSP